MSLKYLEIDSLEQQILQNCNHSYTGKIDMIEGVDNYFDKIRIELRQTKSKIKV